MQNSITTVFGLGVLILLFGPVSGAHFNPVVSAVDWLLGRRHRTGLTGLDTAAYTVAQVVGGIVGALLVNVMFDLPAVQISDHTEARPDLLDALVDETADAAAANQAVVDRSAVKERLRTLPAGMRSSMLKDALAGAVLNLDDIAGPVLRAAPDGAPVTRSVVAEIARASNLLASAADDAGPVPGEQR